MLYSISSIITKYFFKKNIITNSDQEVFTYDMEKEVKRVNAPEEEAKELTEEEVNLYGNCGKDKYRCHNDCIIPFTSLLNSSL